MSYSVRRSRPKAAPAPMVGLYIVTSKLGARVMERKSMNSTQFTILPLGFVFNGTPSDAWVRVLGGGYVVSISVREIT